MRCTTNSSLYDKILQDQLSAKAEVHKSKREQHSNAATTLKDIFPPSLDMPWTSPKKKVPPPGFQFDHLKNTALRSIKEPYVMLWLYVMAGVLRMLHLIELVAPTFLLNMCCHALRAGIHQSDTMKSENY